MSEHKDNKEFAFIKEVIKEKPVNKKKWIKQAIFVAIYAAIFGFVACLVFVIAKPRLTEQFGKEEEPVVEVSTDEDQETEAEAEKEQETTEPTVEPQELGVTEYQTMQNKLYEIGKTADNFIVTVTAVTADTDWFNTPYEKEGQGSGIIISDTGKELLVLAQKSVVENAQKIQISFADETTAVGTIKSYDGNTGIAIISIPIENIEAATYQTLQVATLGSSVGIERGDVVIAVGSPLGTNYSILTGNVTSVNNELSTIDRNISVFTSDIVGNADGSGALLNTSGQVVGIIMQEYALSGSENTLTAVSVSEIKSLLNELLAGSQIPYLGCRICTVTEEIASEYSLPKGAYVVSVEMDSPAMAAGIQNGDVIVKIDDKIIHTDTDYESELATLTPGKDTAITVKRMGGDQAYHEIDCTATAGVMP